MNRPFYDSPPIGETRSCACGCGIPFESFGGEKYRSPECRALAEHAERRASAVERAEQQAAERRQHQARPELSLDAAAAMLGDAATGMGDQDRRERLLGRNTTFGVAQVRRDLTGYYNSERRNHG